VADSGLIEKTSKCMKCGFCMSSCPVYRVDHMETHVARGRNMLINWAEKNEIASDDSFRESIYYCLLCNRCEATCPARVASANITLDARANLVKQNGLPWFQRIIYRGIIRHRSLMARGLGLASWLPGVSVKEGKPFRHLADFVSIFAGGLAIPRISKPFLSRRIPPRTYPPKGTKVRGEIAVFPGCAFEFFFAGAGKDMVLSLAEAGFEVVYPGGLTCCGLAVHSAGDFRTARLMAKENMEVLSRFDYIVTGCATCGSALKNYGDWFSGDDHWQTKARDFSRRVKDFSEFLFSQGFSPSDTKTSPVTVTYHDPCHLRWHQGINDSPRKILNAAPGINYIEMEGADKCCGLGGSFGITHREVSLAIQRDKIESIERTKAEVVVTSCPGCMIQLMDGMSRHRVSCEVMHLSQLIRGQRGRLRMRR